MGGVGGGCWSLGLVAAGRADLFISNTKSIISDTESIICNTKSINLNTESIICNRLQHLLGAQISSRPMLRTIRT